MDDKKRDEITRAVQSLAGGPKSVADVKQAMEGGVEIDPCGCKSTVVKDDQGRLGKSLEMCEAHTLQRIGSLLAETARTFGHLAGIKLNEKKGPGIET